MANVIFPKYKEAALQGNGNLASGNVKAVLVDLADYTYSAAHEFLSDVPVAARIATSGNLAGKTFSNGTFDSENFTFTGVAGDAFEALILFIDTGTPSTSRLVAFYDTGPGFPLTPNGGNIDLSVDAAGWFTLGG